ncbi:hypothetical protein DY218_27330 [Streptomyces triticagri]|uniref:DUF6879 domain-containing protein n=1 Tax=Streptomyces triticagri TaxID=2293568 RepID=A0A372LY86_9ACTN|nr:DUF6879 family protein [Streptomyces triticagri]RFU83622.1 hypothetical protein DY218_27330 [Streptomyces triticagri]
MPQNDPPGFEELLAAAQHSACHLEMRDVYGVGDEQADFEHFLRTGERDTDPASEYWTPWVDLIGTTTARGVSVRRARIVSEPVTPYIRYEHAGTGVNVQAGEDVRWLPRRQASDLALPGNDLWLFDRTAVLFNHFAGDGNWSEPKWEVRTEPYVVDLAASAFEAVWDRGIPHEKYTV